MLELACHTWGFSDLPLEQAVQIIARLGFNYIDLGSGPHLDTDTAAKDPESEAARIRELLDYYHLQVTDLYLLLPLITSRDEGRRLYEVKLFERLVPFAVALGAPGITLSPGILPPEKDPDPFAVHPADATSIDKTGQATEESPSADTPVADALSQPAPPTPFDNGIKSLQRCVEVVADTDLRLSIEPHLDSIAPTPEKALELISAVPGLSITLDWSHFTAQGIVSREVEPLLQHVAHVQVRQAARDRLQVPFNEGGINLADVLTLIVKSGYRGALSVEYMKTEGWHGMAALDVVRETGYTRDALRDYRRALLAT